jgi:hypothetical protein
VQDLDRLVTPVGPQRGSFVSNSATCAAVLWAQNDNGGVSEVECMSPAMIGPRMHIGYERTSP